MRQNQASKHQDNSSSQKSALAERNEPAVKDSSQLSQSGCLQNHSGSHSKHSTQCSHHSQKCGHVCNNKHGHNHSNAVQDSNIHQRSVTHKSASQSQCSQAFLSQPGPDLSPKERLLWLQKRREVGLWVQCCRPSCNKWRYLHDIHDPLEVPEKWFCHMNSGNFVQYISLFNVQRFSRYGTFAS
jgi:transposase